MYYNDKDASMAEDLILKALRMLSAAQSLVEEPGIVIRDDSPEDYLEYAKDFCRQTLNTIHNERTKKEKRA